MATPTTRVKRFRRTLLPKRENNVSFGDIAAMVNLHEFPGLTHGAIRIIGEVRHQETYGNSLLHGTFHLIGTPLTCLVRFHGMDRLGDPIENRLRLVWTMGPRGRRGSTRLADRGRGTTSP